jgi:hypothetical protein
MNNDATITLTLTPAQLEMIYNSLNLSHLYDKCRPIGQEWNYLIDEIRRLHHTAEGNWPNKPLGTVKF